jgi:hypothetical protein
MTELIRYPQTVFLLSFVVLWLAARIGAAFKATAKFSAWSGPRH